MIKKSDEKVLDCLNRAVIINSRLFGFSKNSEKEMERAIEIAKMVQIQEMQVSGNNCNVRNIYPIEHEE